MKRTCALILILTIYNNAIFCISKSLKGKIDKNIYFKHALFVSSQGIPFKMAKKLIKQFSLKDLALKTDTLFRKEIIAKALKQNFQKTIHEFNEVNKKLHEAFNKRLPIEYLEDCILDDDYAKILLRETSIDMEECSCKIKFLEKIFYSFDEQKYGIFSSIFPLLKAKRYSAYIFRATHGIKLFNESLNRSRLTLKNNTLFLG